LLKVVEYVNAGTQEGRSPTEGPALPFVSLRLPTFCLIRSNYLLLFCKNA